MTKRMTASELKYQHETHNPDSYFFTRSSMKFFGDTMSNYYVPANTVLVENYDGSFTECYELQRRRAVKHGLNKSAYFSVDTLERVHGKNT